MGSFASLTSPQSQTKFHNNLIPLKTSFVVLHTPELLVYFAQPEVHPSTPTSLTAAGTEVQARGLQAELLEHVVIPRASACRARRLSRPDTHLHTTIHPFRRFKFEFTLPSQPRPMSFARDTSPPPQHSAHCDTSSPCWSCSAL